MDYLKAATLVLAIALGSVFYYNLEFFGSDDFGGAITGAATTNLGNTRQVTLQSGAEKGCTSGSEFITGVYTVDNTYANKIDKLRCTLHGLTLPGTKSAVTPSNVAYNVVKEFKCPANYAAVSVKKTDYTKVSTINYFRCEKLPNGYSLTNEENVEVFYGNSKPLGYIALCPANKVVTGFIVTDNGNGDYTKKIMCANIDDGQTPSAPTDGTCVNGQFNLVFTSDASTTVNGNPSAILTPVSAWTASIPGASWIWSSGDRVATSDTTITLQRQFTLPSSVSNVVASVKVAADNKYACDLNGQNIGGDTGQFNYRSGDEDTYNFNSLPIGGANTFKCDVTNIGVAGSTFANNPGGLLYKVQISGSCSTSTGTTQCNDGIDNNDPEDTLADYPNDPGCSSASDNDESNAAQQCLLSLPGTNDKVSLTGTIERACNPLASEFIDGLYKSTTTDGSQNYVDGFRCSTHGLTLPNPTTTDTITLPKHWEIQAYTEYKCNANHIMVKIKPYMSGQTFNLFDSFSCIELPSGYSTANIERVTLQSQQGVSKANLCPSNKVMIGVKTVAPNNYNTNNHIGEIICANIEKPATQCSAPTAMQCGDGIDNDNDGKIDFGTATTNDPGCSSLADNDETDGSPVPPPPAPACGNGIKEGAEQCDDGNQVNTDTCSNTCTSNDAFPNDPCSFSVLNDKCGYTNCNSDIDGDGYFTDSSTSDQNGKGCDKKRGDVCSALVLNDLQGLIAPTIPSGGVISTEGIEIEAGRYFEIFPDAYTTPQPSLDWPRIVKFIGFDVGTKQITVQINNLNSEFASSSLEAPYELNIVSGGETFKAFVQANGKLTVDMDADGTITVNKKIPVPLASCSATTGNTCELLTATWLSTQEVNEGQEVQLKITATPQCNSKTVVFNVFEDDPIGDDLASINPPLAIVTNGEATSTWIVEFMEEGFGGNPEYYFQASTTGSQIKSGNINAKRSADGSICGNNQVDGTEDCFTCSRDAGCTNGEICCVDNSGNAACSTSCIKQQSDDGDNTCENSNDIPKLNKENCIANACDKKSAGCLLGEICTSGSCGCNDKPDGICPKDAACKQDPDCDIDGDGKDDATGDNCPGVANSGQEDYDIDSIGCSYDFERKGVHVNTGLGKLCGGDACDMDADNDGVCNADMISTSQSCTGEDMCHNTPSGSQVDENGCSEGQAQCLSAWDCTSVQWSECDPSTRTRTRNVGSCDSYDDVVVNNLCRCKVNPNINPECFQTLTLHTSEACEVGDLEEEEVPIFGWMNFLAAIGLLSAYYALRRRA